MAEADEQRWEWRRIAPWAAAYLATGLLIALQQADQGQAPFYVPVAIGVAFLLVCGRRYWPLLVGLELVVATAQYNLDVPGGTISAIVTVGEAVLAVTLLDALGFRRSLDRPDSVVLLAVVAALTAILGATVGVALLEAIGYPQSVGEHWRIWAVGEASALMVVVPAILLWTPGRSAIRARLSTLGPRARAEFVTIALVGLVAVVVFFAGRQAAGLRAVHAGLLMLCMLPPLWVGLRFGPMRASVYLPAIDVAALVAFTGWGEHFGSTTTTSYDVLPVQVTMFAIALATMAVAVAIEAESRARAQEAAVVDASPLAVITVDEDGHTLLWNAAAEKMFGYSAAEAVGRPLPIIPPDGIAAFHQQLEQTARGRLDAQVEYRRADGSRLTGRLTTAPLRDARGTFYATLGMIDDITDTIAAEEQRALLTEVLDQAAEAVVVTDTTPAIVYVNPAALESSGYAMHELLGRDPRIFGSGLHDKTYFENLWRTLQSGTPWRGVLINRRKTGEYYEERTTIAPVVAQDGTTMAYVAVKHDLTRERALEADLEREQHDRQAVQMVIEEVQPAETLEATIGQLCSAVVRHTEFDGALLLLLRPDGSLTLGGRAAQHLGGAPSYTVTPADGAAELVARTSEGVWWRDWTRASPTSDRFRDEHLRLGSRRPRTRRCAGTGGSSV